MFMQGMEYLHSKKIVHFDLKSANLLLGYRDRRAICKVADFGLSKQKRDTYVSGVSSQRGTLPWIAPEIIKAPHAVNEKVLLFLCSCRTRNAAWVPDSAISCSSCSLKMSMMPKLGLILACKACFASCCPSAR